MSEVNIVWINPKALVRDALSKSTPVARRWAHQQMKNGKSFPEIEDEFMDIFSIENRLYETMKNTMIHHVQLHGLDSCSAKYFEEFKNIRNFSRNNYVRLMQKIRQELVKISREGGSGAAAHSHYLEYLISKITEYVKKVMDVGKVAYQMLMEGKSPDLVEWSDKCALQDAMFEEDKQFLKQSLNHLAKMDVLHKGRFGVDDIRMLLYHKRGCRRQKLYIQVENWIITIYKSLPESPEKDQIYREICDFVAELVPNVGYITPGMIAFIFDRGFLSATSFNLLLRIYPVIKSLRMDALFTIPLQKMIAGIEYNPKNIHLIGSDLFVLEICRLYAPKIIPDELVAQIDFIDLKNLKRMAVQPQDSLSVAEIVDYLDKKEPLERNRLYRQAEIWVMELYNIMPDGAVKDKLYNEICFMVGRFVPSVGYITPAMIRLLLNHGYLNENGRLVLENLHSVLVKMGMNILLELPLQKMMVDVTAHFRADSMTPMDWNVVKIARLYIPTRLPSEIMRLLPDED